MAFLRNREARYPTYATTRNDLRSPGHQKAAWVGAVVLALVFVSMGLMNVLALEPMPALFDAWGYPTWFMYVVGVLEIVGAAYVLIPRVATYGGALLALILLGAIGTLVAAGQWLFIPLALVFAALAGYVAWVRMPDAAGIGSTERRPARDY